jgi:hypothetical protein
MVHTRQPRAKLAPKAEMIEGERLGVRMNDVGDKGEARAFKRSRYPIEL